MNEKQMQEMKAVWPKTEKKLIAHINKLLKECDDYGKAVYAMSLAACAAFNYVSHIVGATGFQASCADLDFIRRTRSIEGGFIFLKVSDMLYPQCDLSAKLLEFIESNDNKKWLCEQAKKRLSEDLTYVSKTVLTHWEKLAAWKEPDNA